MSKDGKYILSQIYNANHDGQQVWFKLILKKIKNEGAHAAIGIYASNIVSKSLS